MSATLHLDGVWQSSEDRRLLDTLTRVEQALTQAGPEAALALIGQIKADALAVEQETPVKAAESANTLTPEEGGLHGEILDTAQSRAWFQSLGERAHEAPSVGDAENSGTPKP